MLIAFLAIALAVSISLGAYALLYKSVITTPVAVIGVSDQLKMFVTQPHYWDFDTKTAGEVATQLAAGHTYTLYLGVWNQLNEKSGPTYMMYKWDAPGNNHFRLSYLVAYIEANIQPDSPDTWPSGVGDVYWSEYDYDGDGYLEVVMYCAGDISQGGYKIPAGYRFTTEMWFTLGDIPTLGNGITLTVYEFSSASDLPFTSGGTLLPYVTGMPIAGSDYTFDMGTVAWQ
jgi:hypothetical protein